MENKLTIFKGSQTEAKFDNGMTIELWYDKKHNYNEAKPLLYDLVKCWNMHDEMLEALKDIYDAQTNSKRSLHSLNESILKTKELIKKAES